MCPICKRMSYFKIYNRELMDFIEMKCPHEYDPVKRTLDETLEIINKEIYHKTIKYGEIQRNIAILTTDIKEIEKGHHELFDQHFEEVKKKAQLEHDKIINEAKQNANKLNNESKMEYNRNRERASRLIEEERQAIQRKLEQMKKDFKQEVFMEHMFRQHKRNFIDRYDEMMIVLEKFQTLMKQVEVKVTCDEKSAKKEIYNLIKNIKSWEIKEFVHHM